MESEISAREGIREIIRGSLKEISASSDDALTHFGCGKLVNDRVRFS